MEIQGLQILIDAINYRGIVSGFTHDFYRYPARFSPLFARAAIDLFSQPGDTVFDPFVGSGTTLVEALASGRNAVGTDISRLAVFLGNVKTQIVNQRDRDRLLDWANDVAPDLSPLQPVERHWEWKEAGYQDNMPWRFRKVAEQAINGIASLPEKLHGIARCIVLRTVQWAVDCKKRLPTSQMVRDRLIDHAVSAADGLEALYEQVRSLGLPPSVIEVLYSPVDTISSLESPLLKSSPKLVVTSPPYPGVHVLYHRWQVQGRKETPAPFWIADCQDGMGSSFYTFGDRRNQRHEEIYFEKLVAAYLEIRRVVHRDAYVVQLVGFGKPEVHLPIYLDVMKQAGFEEHESEGHRSQYWRSVPNRKWYTWLKSEIKKSSEILLIHRPS